jgi:hypothetical protein
MVLTATACGSLSAWKSFLINFFILQTANVLLKTNKLAGKLVVELLEVKASAVLALARTMSKPPVQEQA